MRKGEYLESRIGKEDYLGMPHHSEDDGTPRVVEAAAMDSSATRPLGNLWSILLPWKIAG